LPFKLSKTEQIKKQVTSTTRTTKTDSWHPRHRAAAGRKRDRVCF